MSENEVAIVQLRAAGESVPAIAVRISRGVDCVYRALRRPYIRAALAECRAATLRPHYDLTRNELQKSIERLVAVRDAEGATAANRIKASVAIADLCLKLHQVVVVATQAAEFDARLSAMEVARNTTPGDDADA